MSPTLSSLPMLLPLPGLAHACPPADVPLHVITWAEAAPIAATVGWSLLAVAVGLGLVKAERAVSAWRAARRDVMRKH